MVNSVANSGNFADTDSGQCPNGENGRAAQFPEANSNVVQSLGAQQSLAGQQSLNQQSLNQHPNNSQNSAYCENPPPNSFPNGQYLNSSAYYSSSPYAYKSAAGSRGPTNGTANVHHPNSGHPTGLPNNLDNLSNSLNQYLTGQPTNPFHCKEAAKPANEFDRTPDCKPMIDCKSMDCKGMMNCKPMDCKPMIHSNHPFGSSTSNRLNSNSVSSGKPPFCSGCKKMILDRFLLQTMGTYWHEDCLKCRMCDCRLGEVGSSLFTRMEMLLCKRDYLR